MGDFLFFWMDKTILGYSLYLKGVYELEKIKNHWYIYRSEWLDISEVLILYKSKINLPFLTIFGFKKRDSERSLYNTTDENNYKYKLSIFI